MSELVVAKAGGTSNNCTASVEQSLSWAEQSDIFVVSAPGKIAGSDAPKVTDLLLAGRQQYLQKGDVDRATRDQITDRFQAIVDGLNLSSLAGRWTDTIGTRVEEAARHGEHAASMLGERLQAEIYQSLGYELLDPGSAPADLGAYPDAWKAWLSYAFIKGRRYVLPGNTTRQSGHLETFDRGGSDISGGLAAYGIQADLNLNLTDGQAMSADPRLIDVERLRPIEHMLYVEGRELGRNGTGLVHPAAMVPLMRGNIPTEVRSTFNATLPPTLLDNDYVRAEHRRGRIIALSIMNGVAIHRVHEPGMAEATGRLADFDASLAERGIPIVDSQGDGVDSQKYFVEGGYATAARQALEAAVRHGSVETRADIDLITAVGFDISLRRLDHMFDLVFNSGMQGKAWQQENHDLSFNRHSLRLSVDRNDSTRIFDRLHAHFLERPF